MKKIFFIIFLLTSLFASAQDGFEYSVLGGDRQRMQGGGELANGDYVVSNLQASTSWDELTTSLSLLDADGGLKDIVELEYEDYDLVSVGIFVVSDTSFLVLGIARKSNENIKRIWIGEYLNNLDLVDAQLYGPDDIDYKFTVGHLESDSTLLVTGWAFISSTTPYVGRIDFVNDSAYVHLNSELDTVMNVFGCFDVAKRLDSVGYVSLGYFDYYLLNDSFEVEMVVDKPNMLKVIGIGNLMNYTDSTYLMTCEASKFGETVDTNAILLGEVRASDLSLKKFELFATEYESDEEIHNQPASYISIANSKTSNDIFVGGTYDFDETLHNNYGSKFALAKFDSNLEKIWEKKYGNDSIYYQMYGVMGTSDGGCLMHGYRVQYTKDYPAEAYVLKVDEDGLITGETIIPVLQQVHIYPNPAMDYIQFDLPNSFASLDVELIDMSGRIVLTQKITHQEQVDISSLPKGMYGWRLMNRIGALISMGKLLKE